MCPDGLGEEVGSVDEIVGSAHQPLDAGGGWRTKLSPRSAYVSGMHGIRAVFDAAGISSWFARHDGRLSRHLQSLGAIHDLDRMIALDVPWWTYPAIAEVEEFLNDRDGKARVFEYGAGASTVWLAKRASEVHSVEHDVGFAGVLEPRLAEFGHVILLCVEPEQRTPASTVVSARRGHEGFDYANYVRSIEDVGGRFDLIVIDGRARSACLAQAVPHLADDGIVVFDNSGRRRYQAAIEASGLEVQVRRGWAPSLPYRDVTSLLRPRVTVG